MSEELGVRESAVLFDLRPGQWLWLDKPYDEASAAPVVLGPLHVGDGRQHVFWQTRRENLVWSDAQNPGISISTTSGPSLRVARLYPTVSSACDALRWNAVPGITYRLARFDGTPLLTVRRSRRAGWVVRPWR